MISNEAQIELCRSYAEAMIAVHKAEELHAYCLQAAGKIWRTSTEQSRPDLDAISRVLEHHGGFSNTDAILRRAGILP